jgi:colanic acid biosynthesis glycosyl transferase WcaI
MIVMADPGTGVAAEVAGAGLIVPPGDAAMLASSVIALAESDGLRAKFGVAARLRAQQRWDRLSIIRSFEREFALLLADLPALPDAAPQSASALPDR